MKAWDTSPLGVSDWLHDVRNAIVIKNKLTTPEICVIFSCPFGLRSSSNRSPPPWAKVWVKCGEYESKVMKSGFETFHAVNAWLPFTNLFPFSANLLYGANEIKFPNERNSPSDRNC